VKAKG